MNVRKLALFAVLASATSLPASAETLMYHEIRTDAAGKILPWSHDEPGKAYDHVLGLVWKFWIEMRTDLNGLPYYMNHQVWRPDANDPRGIAGSEFEMALSSWQLYYMYTGDERVRENARFIADYYLTHGLSPADSKWPNLPYPYNTLIYSGVYDGDMVIGAGYTQPDKAGSFANELVRLARTYNPDGYPQATNRRYLEAAIAIANTLAAQTKEGDADVSPLPFKVNALTGQVGPLLNNNRSGHNVGEGAYTTNWAGTLELFQELSARQLGDVAAYERASARLLAWMKRYPMQNNKWGPFFEDIPGWSDTQVNAMTWARFIMNHRDLFPDWKGDVQRIIDWVYKTVPNRTWEKYGVTVVNEQTAYQVPGNSHSSRQAADELLFAELTGDTARRAHAVLQLNWATYMVADDGRNRYMQDEIWMSDGYGDYVRHYLRAMASYPEIAPSDEDHVLSSTAILQAVGYHDTAGLAHLNLPDGIPGQNVRVAYIADRNDGKEGVRLTAKPARVLLGKTELKETTAANADGYTWRALQAGGVLTVQRATGRYVTVLSQ